MSDNEASAPHRTTVHWKGFQFTKSHVSGRKTTYRCSFYRDRYNRPGCTAKIDVMSEGRVIEIRFPHTCGGEVIVISSDDDDAHSTLSQLVTRDVSLLMAEETDALAVQQVSVLPSRIWEQVREQFTIDSVTRGLSREQVIRRVYRARRQHFGGSIYGQVEVPPLSRARDGSNFFQFNFTYAC